MKNEPIKQKIRNHESSGFLAERWGFEPQNAFDTLHDFQSCALDQLSHLSIFGCAPQRHTIIPERTAFVKDFLKKMVFSKMTSLYRQKTAKNSGMQKKPLTKLLNRTMMRPESTAAGSFCSRRVE